MAAITEYFIAILFLGLISKGVYGCTLNDFTIGTVRSGRQIQGKPVWDVTVINNCACPQKLIKLACKGFQTAESINPSIFSKEAGDKCLLIKGNSALGGIRFGFGQVFLRLGSSFTFFPSEAVTVACRKNF